MFNNLFGGGNRALPYEEVTPQQVEQKRRCHIEGCVLRLSQIPSLAALVRPATTGL
jgi:hypothetical protein